MAWGAWAREVLAPPEWNDRKRAERKERKREYRRTVSFCCDQRDLQAAGVTSFNKIKKKQGSAAPEKKIVRDKKKKKRFHKQLN